MIKMSGSEQKCHIYVHRRGITPHAHAHIKEFPNMEIFGAFYFGNVGEVLVSTDNQVRKAHRGLDE